jgi:integrase/recombinase XerD
VLWLKAQGLTLLEVHYADVEAYLPYLASSARVIGYTDGQGMLRESRKPLSASSRKGVVACLRGFYRYCLRAEYLDKDPTIDVDTPKVKITPLKVISMEMIRAFLDGTGRERCRVQAHLFAFTLARVGSIALLLWSDVNFATNEISFREPKNGRSYTLPMHPQLRAALLRWQEAQLREAKRWEKIEKALQFEHTAFVLLTRNGKPVATSTLAKQLKWRAARAGVLCHPVPRGRHGENKSEIYPHMIRRSVATSLRHTNVAVEDVADLLNHKDTNTTRNHYAQTSNERMRGTVAQIGI